MRGTLLNRTSTATNSSFRPNGSRRSPRALTPNKGLSLHDVLLRALGIERPHLSGGLNAPNREGPGNQMDRAIFRNRQTSAEMLA